MAIENFCPYLRSYMRIGGSNDTYEVIRLQSFLKTFEGHDYVEVNGVFDEATFRAVSAFQSRYQSDVLTPWGISQPTGYAYILTVGKINQIICGSVMPKLEQAPTAPIIKDKVAPLPTCTCPASSTQATYQGEDRAINNDSGEYNPNGDKGQTSNKSPPGVLGAVFSSWPSNWSDFFECLYELLAIIIGLYIIGFVLNNVLYKGQGDGESVENRSFVTWLVYTLGFLLALIIAYVLGVWCIVLPLLVATIFSLIWFLASNKYGSLRASVKSWYLVIHARVKSIVRSTDQTGKK